MYRRKFCGSVRWVKETGSTRRPILHHPSLHHLIVARVAAQCVAWGERPGAVAEALEGLLAEHAATAGARRTC